MEETVGGTQQWLSHLIDGVEMTDERGESSAAAIDEGTCKEKIEYRTSKEHLSQHSPESFTAKESERDAPSQTPFISDASGPDECPEQVVNSAETAEEKIWTDVAREETFEQRETPFSSTDILKSDKGPKERKKCLSQLTFNSFERAVGFRARRKRETPEQREIRLTINAKVNLRQKLERKADDKMKNSNICDTSNQGSNTVRGRGALEKRAPRLTPEEFLKTLTKPHKQCNTCSAGSNTTLSKIKTPEERVSLIEDMPLQDEMTRSTAELEHNCSAEVDEKLRGRAIVVLDRWSTAVVTTEESGKHDEASQIEDEPGEPSFTDNVFCGSEKQESVLDTAGKDLGKVMEKAAEGKLSVGTKKGGGGPRQSGKKKSTYVGLAGLRRKENEAAEERAKRLEAAQKPKVIEKPEEGRKKERKNREETEEERKKWLAARAARYRMARARETDEERERRRAVDRLSRARRKIRKKMEEEFYGQVYVENDEDQVPLSPVERARIESADETEEERKKWLATRAARYRMARARETDKERERRRAIARLGQARRKRRKKIEELYGQVLFVEHDEVPLFLVESMMIKSADEVEEERKKRLAARAERYRMARARETEEERERRLAIARLSRAKKKIRKKMEEELYGQVYVENDEDQVPLSPVGGMRIARSDEMEIDFESYVKDQLGIKMKPVN